MPTLLFRRSSVLLFSAMVTGYFLLSNSMITNINNSTISNKTTISNNTINNNTYKTIKNQRKSR